MQTLRPNIQSQNFSVLVVHASITWRLTQEVQVLVTAGTTLEKQNGDKNLKKKKKMFSELTTDATVPAHRYYGLNKSKQQRVLFFIFWLTDL